MSRTIGKIFGWVLTIIGVVIFFFGGYMLLGAMGANPGGEGGMGVGIGIVGGIFLVIFSLASFIAGRNILKDTEREPTLSVGEVPANQKVKFALIVVVVILLFVWVILKQYFLG